MPKPETFIIFLGTEAPKAKTFVISHWPEMPKAETFINFLQSLCFQPRAPQITFFTTFFTTELMFRAPSAPDHFLY